MQAEQLDRIRTYLEVLMTPSPHLVDEVIQVTRQRLQDSPSMSVVYQACNDAALAVVARYR